MEVQELIKEYELSEERLWGEDGLYSTGRMCIVKGNKAKKDGVLDEITKKKPEIMQYLKEQREKKEAEEEKKAKERQEKIDSIPGLKEIEAAEEDMDNWRREFNKSFEDVGGLGVRQKPEYDFDAMYDKYPIATAYLKAKGEADKQNYELSAIGKRALEKIIDNPEANYKEAIEQMEKELREFSDAHMWD